SETVRPLSVKVVDCGQYPWYYRKYTQQILDLTGIDLDSDSDVDVERLDNSDENDCIIVEGLKNVSKSGINVINSMESVLTAMRLSNNQKRQNATRIKEEYEIQKALSLRNTIKVDFKRNQGLVGMKIKNLPVMLNFKNKRGRKQDLKKSEKTDNDAVVHAAKVLQNVGTEIIPIIENEGEKSQSHLPSVPDNIEDSTGTKAIEESTCTIKAYGTAEKNINRICEQLLNRKSNINPEVNTNSQKVNKSNVISTSDKKNEVEELKNVPIPVTTEKSRNSVKDVTKTNKFKNDQFKKRNKTLLELITSKPNVDQIEVSNKSDNIQTEVSVSTEHKNRDDKSKCEINSPILPSSHSSMKSKNKRGESLKCREGNNSLNNPSQACINLNKNKSFADLFGNTEKLKEAGPKSANPMNKSDYNAEPPSKVSFTSKDVIISPVKDNQYTKAPEKDVTNSNNRTGMNFQKIPSISQESTVNKKDSAVVMKKTTSADSRKKAIVVEQKLVGADNINPSHVRKDNKDISMIATLENIGLCKETDKQNASSTTTYVATLDIPCHSYKPTQASKVNLPNPNSLPNKNNDLPNSGNSFERNSIQMMANTSQKPNIQTAPNNSHLPGHVQAESYRKTNIMRKAMHIPVHTQPQCPYYRKTRVQYHSELPFRYSQYIPSPGNAKSYVPYLKNSTYLGRVPIQSQSVNADRLSQKLPLLMSPLNPQLTSQRHALDGNFGPQYGGSPFNSSVPIPQTLPGPINQPYPYYLKTNNYPVNEKNNLKKTNVKLMPNKDDNSKGKQKVEDIRIKTTETPSANAEVVATKTEMLKELDKLSFDDDAKKDLKRKNPHVTCETERTSSVVTSDTAKKTTKVDEALKTPVSNRIEFATKYSPPILPIPRYDHVLNHIVSDPRGQIDKTNTVTDKTSKQKNTSEMKPVQNTLKRCRKRISHEFKEPSCSRRKCDGKKISLEEYKQRVYVKSASELSKRPGKDNANIKKYRGPGPRMYKKHCNRNPESDLGYDSDSTVVL
ncbi:uncharacterized protein LOC113494089, partial [Trichoplusia ni]|uniref:Uncharacterized protein LOC113494089 n=1 Tax=Trichoplusia ni TaxID=7111 RepID=A0A7E5VIL6_TRINI